MSEKPDYDHLFKDHPNSQDLIKLLKVKGVENVFDDCHIGRYKPGASYVMAYFNDVMLTIRTHPSTGLEIKAFGDRNFPIQIIDGHMQLHGDTSSVQDLADVLENVFR